MKDVWHIDQSAVASLVGSIGHVNFTEDEGWEKQRELFKSWRRAKEKVRSMVLA